MDRLVFDGFWFGLVGVKAQITMKLSSPPKDCWYSTEVKALGTTDVKIQDCMIFPDLLWSVIVISVKFGGSSKARMSASS